MDRHLPEPSPADQATAPPAMGLNRRRRIPIGPAIYRRCRYWPPAAASATPIKAPGLTADSNPKGGFGSGQGFRWDLRMLMWFCLRGLYPGVLVQAQPPRAWFGFVAHGGQI